MHAMYLLHDFIAWITCIFYVHYMNLLHSHVFNTFMHALRENQLASCTECVTPAHSLPISLVDVHESIAACLFSAEDTFRLNQSKTINERTYKGILIWSHRNQGEEIGDVIKVKFSMTRSLPVENLPPIYTLSGRIGLRWLPRMLRLHVRFRWGALIYAIHEALRGYCPWRWGVRPVNWIYRLWRHCP